MPLLARAFVKAAFLYLLVAALLAALMMLDRWLGFSRWLRAVYLSQLHLLVVGWITQLAFGVAYWIFPRLLRSQGRQPRGPDVVTWAVLISLNAGLVMRFAVEPLYLMGPSDWLGALMAVSGVLQALAVLGFGWLIWDRVRPMET
jgi:hypothetical protein